MSLSVSSCWLFYQEHCIYLPAMLGWFLFSALLSSFNKYVFGSEHMHFPCPLLLTSIHFSIQWLFSHVACAIFPITLGADRIDQLTWKDWATTSIPCGLITALDIGLSNLSLVTITITFYTMVKSSTPIFVLAWAHLFGIERITWKLIGVILVLAAGEFLTVAGEVDFVMRGFLLCVMASILSGARWTLVQRNLQSLDPPLKTTIVVMKLLAPSMFFGVLLMSIVLERPWNKLSDYHGVEGMNYMLFLGVVGGSLAVCMVLCEFYLILHASAIILMIGGVIKEMTTIFIGVSYFGDKLNPINIAGCVVVFSAVGMYKVVFHMEREEKRQARRHQSNGDDDEYDVGDKLIKHSGDENIENYEVEFSRVGTRSIA